MTRRSIPSRGTRFFLFFKAHTGSGGHSVSFSIGISSSFFGEEGKVGGRVKLPERDGNHPHPSSAEL